MSTALNINSNVKTRPEKYQVLCPVCDNASYKITYTPWVHVEDPIKLYGAASGLRGTQTLVTCGSCATLYENPRFPEEIILSGYGSASDAGHDSQHKMRVASFYKALCSMRRWIPPAGAKVLDIGTAGGAFLEAAKKFGYDASGLEPSKYLAQAGRQRGLDVVHGTLGDNPFPNASFDLVCLWDVLEHVVDPKQMLIGIREILKPDGVLLINYPDIGTWQAKLAGKKFWWLLSVHIQHFSPRAINKMCELTGFEVFKFKPYWQTLQLGYLFNIAKQLHVPAAGVVGSCLPKFLRGLPVPYYASQTTALARIKS